MKTCPVCYEKYDDTVTGGQVYPDICPACNEAFGIPSPIPEPPAPFPEVPPPPPETPAERRERLTAKARELLILELCHHELCRRIDADERRAKMWHLKDKVSLGMAAYLRATLPTEFRTPLPSLSNEEADHVLATHPLLQLAPPLVTGPSLFAEQIRLLRTRLRRLYSKQAERSADPDNNHAATEP